MVIENSVIRYLIRVKPNIHAHTYIYIYIHIHIRTHTHTHTHRINPTELLSQGRSSEARTRRNSPVEVRDHLQRAPRGRERTGVGAETGTHFNRFFFFTQGRCSEARTFGDSPAGVRDLHRRHPGRQKRIGVSAPPSGRRRPARRCGR